MKQGNIVEYIDRRKIVCAVVLEIKKQRLRLLTETNREVSLSSSRVLHNSNTHIDLSMGKDRLVETLKEIVKKRKHLMNYINIKELWEILNTEQEWIDLATMTEFCFTDILDDDHESAVLRAFFEDQIYFKFKSEKFFPNSKEKVERLNFQVYEINRKNILIERGGRWLKSILNGNDISLSKSDLQFVEILKSFYLFGKESKQSSIAKEILKKANIDADKDMFRIFVKLGIWNENENLDIYRYNVPVAFSDKTLECAKNFSNSFQTDFLKNNRKDFTMLPLITIDGQLTLDFDDALSVEEKKDHYILGVHIADVGHFIKKGSIIDREAINRGSSIYTFDQRISMLPTCLAEEICSLKTGKLRPAISIIIKLNKNLQIIDYKIIPSIVKVKRQLTYHDVNLIANEDREIIILHEIAKCFRRQRIANGALPISLPEINIWMDENGEIAVNRVNRESPSRMLVSEIMIMANWIMARFLAKHNTPAIFRSQPEPKARLYKGNQGTLFQNWMQRKNLSRFVLNCRPEHHSGLGLDAYVTATSPIRKYFDLVTQRQIRAILKLEAFYKIEDIEQLIMSLKQTLSSVSKIQSNRHRYWIFKYLEKKIGQKEEAVLLYKRRNSYSILIPAYMIECDLPLTAGTNFKPEDIFQVTIQHVDARNDIISVFV